MKKFLNTICILAGLAVLTVAAMVALLPWMDRWGATDEEIAAAFTGDELVPSPRLVYNRAVAINAAQQEFIPGLYSSERKKAACTATSGSRRTSCNVS